MATSRRESQPTARLNRAVRNMSPALKPSESDQRLRRARSVPSSPDRKSSASTTAANSANACRPSSSFNPRSTASSRSSTSGSASSSSSTHGKSTLLHSVSSMVGAKQAAGIMRRRADKSVWTHALTTPSTTSPNKDPASKAAKSPASNVQKSKLSTRPGAEKTVAAAAASSPKPRTQKATPRAGKTLTTSSSSRNPGATAKRRTGLEISVPFYSIQRTTSVPVAPKVEEHDVELLVEEFDEMESISTPSIEEHLQQWLPDPVDVTTYAASEHAPSEPSSNQEEHENGHEVIKEHMFSEEKQEELNGLVVAKEALGETENEAAVEIGLKESADKTELNESFGEIELKGTVDEPKLNEADSETEIKDPELTVKEEAEANEERVILPATKTPEAVQRWRKEDGSSNEVAEESRSKTTSMQERRNKVMALVGRFETAMSGRE